MDKKSKADFSRLFSESIAEIAMQEESILVTEAEKSAETAPETLDAKIGKIATKTKNNRSRLRLVAAILIGIVLVNCALYVGVEAYRVNINQYFGDMQRNSGEDGNSVSWNSDDGPYGESFSGDEAMDTYFRDNFPYHIEVPIGIHVLEWVSLTSTSSSVRWIRPEDIEAAEDSNPVNHADFFINTYSGEMDFESYEMAAKGEKDPCVKEVKIEEIEVQGHQGYIVYGYQEEGPYYRDGAFEPLYNRESLHTMAIYWYDDENTYSFTLQTAPDYENWEELQDAWKNAILAMEPNPDAPEMVLADPDKAATAGVGQASFSEELRERNIGIENRYDQVKNQPWDTKTLSVETNSKLWLEATKDFDLHCVFQTTYWDFSLKEIKADFAKFAGENVQLSDDCVLLKKEQVKAGSPLSNAYAGGNKFYILTLMDEEGEEAQLYLLSDSAIEEEPYRNPNEEINISITAFPLGLNEDGNLVFCQ